jgi:radical SAM superfamily enzyme YgiQ (UPF0313 family)
MVKKRPESEVIVYSISKKQYRPPTEAFTFLVPATIGCSWRRCTFCDMYRADQFRTVPLADVEERLRAARAQGAKLDRVFLANGNAFVLSTQRLQAIARLVTSYFPMCNTISINASIRDIARKSDEDLVLLRDLGINDLHIGMESGSDAVIAQMKKGYTAKEAQEQLHRLNRAGLRYMLNFMLGVAGAGQGQKNAKATAEFLNGVDPWAIWFSTLVVFPGTKLWEQRRAGEFTEATEGEKLQEEQTLLENLDLHGAIFYGIHPNNVVHIRGVLQDDKTMMLRTIDQALAELSPSFLSTPARRSGM